MYNLTKGQRSILIKAMNALSRKDMIESFHVTPDGMPGYAECYFECYRVEITAPMKNALQFRLVDGNADTLVDSIITEHVIDQIPMERLIMSLFGSILLQSFRAEWDGYTFCEINKSNMR